MEHFKEYLSFIQNFNFRVNEIRDKRIFSKKGSVYGRGYDIRHQNPYFSFQFSSHLRILKDLAVVDLIASDNQRRVEFLKQVDKVLERFNLFWENYHNSYPKVLKTFDNNFLLVIDFGKIFYANILEPNKVDIIVTWEFVEDLCDSVREREESLAVFVSEILLLDSPSNKAEGNPEGVSEHPPTKIKRYPVFVEGTADQLFIILKKYFPTDQQKKLNSLLKDNVLPKNKLLFNSNGNQLADAFKQLIEANLIVSFSKAELEGWIVDNFQYVSNSLVKPFTVGYLNSIVSSDVKVCKSPILKILKDSSELVPMTWSKKGKNP
ncbi:hypothetical protein ACFP1I_21985 [Dyadobacter subterraneus]|uniref:Uncharacterized protein n=1 Tax=Dyadobacter subterraneus TaxID=2773304 RepID=A0ABR9W535_9BACT|nr:hypothetical protein [Dyadobacter subterraneus]MBE9460565.1 hypothetical protein [Dyadobacter subterraneus]